MADLNLTICYDAVYISEVIVHLPHLGGLEINLPSTITVSNLAHIDESKRAHSAENIISQGLSKLPS